MPKPFIIANGKSIKALPHWLKRESFNTYSFSSLKRINLGWDSNPDSDWGGKYEWRAAIVVANAGLFERTKSIIDKEIDRVQERREKFLSDTRGDEEAA